MRFLACLTQHAKLRAAVRGDEHPVLWRSHLLARDGQMPQCYEQTLPWTVDSGPHAVWLVLFPWALTYLLAPTLEVVSGHIGQVGVLDVTSSSCNNVCRGAEIKPKTAYLKPWDCERFMESYPVTYTVHGSFRTF